MKEVFPSCCICAAEASWVRARMPNEQQMEALCHRHYEALKERNHLLASYYDVIGTVPALYAPPAPDANSERRANTGSGCHREV